MGKDSVLVVLADGKFVDQAKQLFSTLHWNSGWLGDYCLLAYKIPESELTWFNDKGIHVKNCAPLDVSSEKIGDKITACKVYLFDMYFKKWEKVVYLDVDIVTRGSIQGVLSDLKGFGACYSLGQTLESNLIDFSGIPVNIAEDLKANYDLKQKAFNSGVMVFPASIIKEGMTEDLLRIFNKYVLYGSFGGDQLPFNLYFYNKWSELPPAYNQITPLRDENYNTEELKGLIIHCVSFGDGPWDVNSLFYEEWRANLSKADYIDLNSVPNITVPSVGDVRKMSRSVVKTYFLGGRLRPHVILERMLSAMQILFANPAKFVNKVKSIFFD
jgi:lipopolysaccharide biosynthesis glycosyltransferase